MTEESTRARGALEGCRELRRATLALSLLAVCGCHRDDDAVSSTRDGVTFVNACPYTAAFNFTATHTAPPDGIFNVRRDYGAAGDGTTDDTAAIQSAIDCSGAAAPANGQGYYGGSVFLPAGTYLITRPLSVVNTRGIHLYGAGAATVIRYQPASATVTPFAASTFPARGDSNYNTLTSATALLVGMFAPVGVIDVIDSLSGRFEDFTLDIRQTIGAGLRIVDACPPGGTVSSSGACTPPTGGVFYRSHINTFRRVRIAGNGFVANAIQIGDRLARSGVSWTPTNSQNDFVTVDHCEATGYLDFGVLLSGSNSFNHRFVETRLDGGGTGQVGFAAFKESTFTWEGGGGGYHTKTDFYLGDLGGGPITIRNSRWSDDAARASQRSPQFIRTVNWENSWPLRVTNNRVETAAGTSTAAVIDIHATGPTVIDHNSFNLTADHDIGFFQRYCVASDGHQMVLAFTNNTIGGRGGQFSVAQLWGPNTTWSTVPTASTGNTLRATVGGATITTPLAVAASTTQVCRGG